MPAPNFWTWKLIFLQQNLLLLKKLRNRKRDILGLEELDCENISWEGT
jgi:hypothetical protein